MRTISFIAQLDNETDKDRCRYVLATLDADLLAKRSRALEFLRENDEGINALVFEDGLVELHVMDGNFPISDDCLEDGEYSALSEGEQCVFDAEGWASIPPATVSGIPTTHSGFQDEVYDPRVVVSELGLQIWASWALDSGEAVVRSWTVGWEIMDAAVGDETRTSA